MPWISKKRLDDLEKRISACEYASTYVDYSGFSARKIPLTEAVKSMANALHISFEYEYARAPSVKAMVWTPVVPQKPNA